MSNCICRGRGLTIAASMSCRLPIRSGARLLFAVLVFTVAVRAANPAELKFTQVNRSVIEQRLRAFSTNDGEREAGLKKLFEQSGCAGDRLSEQPVKHESLPNVICTLPGETDEVVIVGAHFDHVNRGDGVVDNWSGAALLPSLYVSLSSSKRRHTYVFVGFTGEEHGLIGSAFYAKSLPPDRRAQVQAMVNIDSVGLSPTKVWVSHSDGKLLALLAAVAKAVQLSVHRVDVEQVGSADSESFAKVKIPRITIHSVTQETLKILHSPDDRLDAIKLDDYYDTYRLMAAYLTFLDGYLGENPGATQATAN